MRLETGLYASRSGLDVNGQAIAVIGDNVAHANTTAFKSSRAEFGDLVQDANDGRESDTMGSGARVTAVRTIQTPGDMEFTGRQLDVGITGRGFFMVGDPSAPQYTRDGTFSVNKDGLLVNSQGLSVLGYAGSAAVSGNPTTLNVANVSATGTATSNISIFGNLDSTTATKTQAPSAPASFSALNQAASYLSSTTVYDSLGASHDITLAFTKTGVNTWVAQAYINGKDTGGTDGVPVQLGANLTLAFDSTGAITAASKANAKITATPAYSGGAAAGNFAIDLSGFNQVAAASQPLTSTQDGVGVGTITGYEITKDGKLYGMSTSGQNVLIGTIPVATFTNEEGLQRLNGSLYAETSVSGTKTVGAPNSGAGGSLQGGALERSTVDLATEFTNMIIYQRGYQASSQALNTTNQVLRDTIGLMH